MEYNLTGYNSSEFLNLPAELESYDYYENYDNYYNHSVLPVSEGSNLDETHSKVQSIIEDHILPVIVVFGICGIILTLIVLSRKSMVTSTNTYLTALAVADLLFLVILSTILIGHKAFINNSSSYIRAYLHIASIVMNMFLFSSVWVTVMLAVERYIAICKPFFARLMCTVKRAILFICLIFAISIIIKIPSFFEFQIMTEVDPLTNITFVHVKNTELFDNATYMVIYTSIIDGLLFTVLPFILLVVLNVYLICEVRRSSSFLRRNTLNDSDNSIQKEEFQITLMLISVIVVFFICQAPMVIFTSLFNLNKTRIINTITPTLFTFMSVSKLLITIKSAVNFVLYCWFSEKFWQTFKKIVCVQKCSNHYHSIFSSEHNTVRSSNRNFSYVYTSTRDTSV
ncbi:unnamed protein product [Owenia fusiformis]|uniref:Uncharacterized protein n=1 Tax=Owenia fusiformis TaxID=6347 RepID=A0A8J1XGG6_OWEFU|nr:unnamed protein product [Owenia fusiformis]